MNKIMANSYYGGLLDAYNDKCYNFKVLQININILVKTREQLQLNKVPIYY